MKTAGADPLMGGKYCKIGDGLKAHGIGYLPQQSLYKKIFRHPYGKSCCQENAFAVCRRPFYGKEQRASLREKYAPQWIYWDLKKKKC